MNVQNRKKSWYVIIGIPSFLYGLEGCPSEKEGSRPALWSPMSKVYHRFPLLANMSAGRHLCVLVSLPMQAKTRPQENSVSWDSKHRNWLASYGLLGHIPKPLFKHMRRFSHMHIFEELLFLRKLNFSKNGFSGKCQDANSVENIISQIETELIVAPSVI